MLLQDNICHEKLAMLVGVIIDWEYRQVWSGNFALQKLNNPKVALKTDFRLPGLRGILVTNFSSCHTKTQEGGSNFLKPATRLHEP